MNETEQEGIILNSAWEMIDNMVNWAMFVKFDEPMRNVLFETSQHARLFNILLGDFLSEIRSFKKSPMPFGLPKVPANARPSDLTYLFHLRRVCANPKLADDPSELADAVDAFTVWLEEELIAEGVNLSAISVVADIPIQRLRYLKICGDIAKHNIARLETNVGHIRNALAASGNPVSEQDGYLAVEGFYEWFHDNIFIAHSSVIADFLNNIRLAMYDYLHPEFKRAYVRTDHESGGMYTYDVPAAITEPVGRAMYWDLMNRMRSKPWMSRFAISASFKEIY